MTTKDTKPPLPMATAARLRAERRQQDEQRALQGLPPHGQARPATPAKAEPITAAAARERMIRNTLKC